MHPRLRVSVGGDLRQAARSSRADKVPERTKCPSGQSTPAASGTDLKFRSEFRLISASLWMHRSLNSA
eukprot:284210-Prymnesium_polylepis.1